MLPSMFVNFEYIQFANVKLFCQILDNFERIELNLDNFESVLGNFQHDYSISLY